MAKCKLCQKDAGLFSKLHKDCQIKKDDASKTIRFAAMNTAISNKGYEDLGKLSREAQSNFISDQEFKGLMIQGWEDAVKEALEDDLLSVDEQKSLIDFQKNYKLTSEELNSNNAYFRVGRAETLRMVLNEKVPVPLNYTGQLPFNLKNGESLIWVFQNVSYYEDRDKTIYMGGYSGANIRVMKGVYYRMGGFRGEPFQTTERVMADVGMLGISTEHIYFSGDRKSFRIPYEKIVSFKPYSDGIGICRDALTAKPQVFVTDEGWFTYNLISNVSKWGKVDTV